MERVRVRKGMECLGNALKVTLGVGAALGGSYLLSRIGEKQNTESSLSRLEQMLTELAETESEAKPAAKKKK